MFILPSSHQFTTRPRIPRARTRGSPAVKKLALNLDALAVETFETSEARRGAIGTVHGNLDEAQAPELVAAPYTQAQNCTVNPTCGASCQSCMPTCGYTVYPCCQIG